LNDPYYADEFDDDIYDEYDFWARQKFQTRLLRTYDGHTHTNWRLMSTSLNSQMCPVAVACAILR
jgi:hypothetical protein